MLEPSNKGVNQAIAIADLYRGFPQVRAVALSGSQATGLADPNSDLDVYIFYDAPIPVAQRTAIASSRAARYEVDNTFWGSGDEWVEEGTGRRVDVVYFGGTWMEDQLDRVLSRHEASVGYTTCLWHTVRVANPLYDRDGWFAALQRRAARPYPEPLRHAIVAKNHPILRETLSSYRYQIERAMGRHDAVSINHRVASLLASVFDILFAVNRLPHPGEKRLVALVHEHCPLVPPSFDDQISAVLNAVSPVNPALLPAIDRLLDGLDELLRAERLMEPGAQ
jgi:hypothetical protein